MVDFSVKRETFHLKVGFVSTLSPEIGDTSQTAGAELTLKAFGHNFSKLKYLQNFLEILSIAPNRTLSLSQPIDRYVLNQFCDQIEHLSCNPPPLTKM